MRALTADGFTEENLDLNGEVPSEYKQQLASILNEGHCSVDTDNLLPDLTADDVHVIIAKAREMKKEQVRVLIDILSNPEEYQTRGKTLKDIFQLMTRDPKKSLSAAVNNA